MPTEKIVYPDNYEKAIDLEKVQPRPEYYPAVDHAMAPVKALPFVRDIVYFKLQMMKNEIVDVL